MCTVENNMQREIKYWPTLTVAFGIIFAVVYSGQLLIDGSLSKDAGYQTATMVKNTVGDGSIVFTWLFHSTHAHFIENLTFFLLTGWWVENRVDDARFILGVAAVLGIGVNVAAALFFQVPGAGISGITTGLGMMIALGAFERLFDSSVRLIKNILDFTFSVVFVLWSVGALGPLTSGTAIEVHVFGAVFGAAWYATEKVRYGFRCPPSPQSS
ncbi:rhomboid family intramembrane serine protease [Halosolutus halophilus]|uniref:rhomboid family intramembrane serine protease n=1 Tax=Halosolutus halophilus TaxID=1552990 RepID=UPI002235239D|nr:rhomboid family intramembrane serine protease [Halosolutus halophilus]